MRTTHKEVSVSDPSPIAKWTERRRALANFKFAKPP
jgi:hypothetical protein